MASMQVRVLDVSGSRICDVEAPDDVTIDRILVLMVEKMGLPLNSPDGQLMSYKLHHRRTGTQLLDNQTLLGAGVKAGDELRLQPEITAGASTNRPASLKTLLSTPFPVSDSSSLTRMTSPAGAAIARAPRGDDLTWKGVRFIAIKIRTQMPQITQICAARFPSDLRHLRHLRSSLRPARAAEQACLDNANSSPRCANVQTAPTPSPIRVKDRNPVTRNGVEKNSPSGAKPWRRHR